MKRSLMNVVLSFSLVAGLLVGCSNASQSVSSEAEIDLTGSPWNDTCIQGNLPEEKPSEKDDFYASVDYDWLEEKQDEVYELAPVYAMASTTKSISEVIVEMINDESNTSKNMDLVRLMYNQALDTDTLDKQGNSTIQPYLDLIDKADSLDALNEVFASKDFPFTPFHSEGITTTHMDGVNIVSISDNLLMIDSLNSYGEYRTEGFDPEDADTYPTTLKNYVQNVQNALLAMGMSDDDISDEIVKLLKWEYQYGKECSYSTEYSDLEYGEIGSISSYLTLDELQEKMGSYPIKKILEKEGRDQSVSYQTADEKWLSAFASIYTEDNLDIIKEVAKLKVIMEAIPYIIPENSLSKQFAVSFEDSGYDTEEEYEQSQADLKAEEAKSRAYTAISQVNTLGYAISDIYVSDYVGDEAKERLTTLSKDLVEVYHKEIEENEWLEEETKEAIYKKLDKMRFNILEPECGYFDYEGVSLKTTEEGGTLFDNYLILKQYVMDQENKWIGQTAMSVSAWITYSPTVQNAFYDPESNSVNIVPGILNENIFTADMSDEEMYGRIGAIIGHELSHAFDYLGSQYDEYGACNDWFAGNDKEEFLEKQQKLADYYNSITLFNNIKADGDKTLTENGADLTGFKAIVALAKNKDLDLDEVYKAYAQLWEVVMDTSYAQLIVDIDSHSQNYLRANVNVQMTDEFYELYDVDQGDTMYLASEDRITIW